MRTSSLCLGARAGRATALAAVIVGGAMILSAHAAPGIEPMVPEQATAQKVAALDVPDLRSANELPPGDGYETSGVVISTQGLVARASKMYITLGEDNPILGALRYGQANDPLDNPTSYNAQKSRVQWPFDPIPCTTLPNDQVKVQYVLSDLTLLTATPDGRLDEVGALPDNRVTLLAFGSVPATATISMAMTRQGGDGGDGGDVTPWQVQVWNPGPQPGCRGNESSSYYRALLEGQADVTLSDLEVDGVPVKLGPNCRTERPVDIQMWGEAGYQALGTGTLGQYDGLAAGTRIPLESPYYLGQNGRGLIPDSTGVDIPPFVGCGVGGDDLSPLVTAMASGPNNPMRVNQGQPMYSGVDPDDIFKCDGPGFCPEPPSSAPEMPPLPDEDTP